MSPAEWLVLYVGVGCIAAGWFILLCERAPVMEWTATDGDVDVDEVRRTVTAPLQAGGVIQRRPRSYIVPKDFGRMRGNCLLGSRCEHGWKVEAPSIEEAAALVESMWCSPVDEEDCA